MANDFKGDPILRTVLVVFAGILVFSFLFGFNFGGTGPVQGAVASHHGAQVGGGTDYFSGLIGGLISFLINVLMLVLIFALIAGVFVGIRKVLVQKGDLFQNCKAMDVVNQDPILKTLLLVIVGIFGLCIISGVFRSLDMGGGVGFSPYFMLFGLLGVILKFLMLALVVSLTIALVQYLKTQFIDTKDNVSSSEQGSEVKPADISHHSGLLQSSSKDEDKGKNPKDTK